jgi:hypothetical protein
MPYWAPQPGPQLLAVTCPADEILFGGSRGGGKSDVLIGRHVAGVQKWGSAWNGLIVRRKYKDFAELRRRWDELIAQGLPAERIGGETQSNYIRFHGSNAQVVMMAFQRLEQAEDIQGHQYPEISVDECTNFPWFSKLVDKLKGANRSPHGVPTHLFFTGNPGGPGHMAVKDYFRLGTGGVTPGTAWVAGKGLDQSARVFIPSFLADNQILCKADPKYVARLLSIQDPVLRKAWLDGSWDVYIGQAFRITNRHITPPIPIPEYVPIYMTFDWGFGKPFSIGWWWVDSEDRIYRCSEWYGWNGSEDEGLRLEDSMIADGIIEREHKMGITGRPIVRLAGPDCWNRKPNYQGGGQGPSTAMVFHQKGLVMKPGDPNRELKIRAFRERLALPASDTALPRMMIYSTCKQFLRTVPALAMDEDNPEDIDTEQEDHIYDEACHIVMNKATGISVEAVAKKIEAKKREEALQTIPQHHRHVWDELEELRRRIEEMEGNQ